jgi:hypothetical protein
MKSNVIELYPNRASDFDYEGYNRRAELRFRRAEIRRTAAAVVETAVAAAIGIGFTVCMLIFFTML